jgi:hypothetical protein
MFAYDVNSKTVQRLTDLDSTTASLDGAGYFARALGSARQLLNQDWIVSWGMVPHITEFDSNGNVNFDMTLSFRTYRTVRAAWTGDPLGRPALAARRDKGVVTAWMSWNGSTRLGAWRLLAGSSPAHLHTIKQIGRHGFETRIRARTSAHYIAVQAIDHHGDVLRQSLPRRPS